MKPQQINSTTLLHPAVRAATRAREGARRAADAMTRFPAMTLVAVAVACVPLLGLGGCASSAGIASTAKPLPAATVGVDGNATTTPAIAADWWRGFGDTALDDLVTRALAGNPGLKVAQARLARAAAAVDGAQASDGPQISAAVDATRQLFSATSIYPPPLGGSVRTLATAQLGGGYEFDFFGRNRAAIEAAIGNQRAVQADVEAARSVLASSVVRGYVQLGRLFAQREVAVRALKQREDMLTLIQQRVQSGLDTAVELRQGEGAPPEARQQIEQLDEQIALARHALAALSAQPPTALDALSPSLRAWPAVKLPATVPADLLGRRADIAAARWRIEAAGSDMQSTKAQFYPNINLTAFVGLSSIGLNKLINAGSEQFGVGPALRLPVFDSGRLRANLRGKAADLDAAIESYNGAVLDAVHDAADQIGSLQSIARQQAQQASAQTAAEAAFDLATQRYKAGLSSYLTVLTAESSVLNQRRQAVDLKARAIDTEIALIRTLGGGYVATGNSGSGTARVAALQ